MSDLTLRALFFPVGSAGDVNPVLGIAAEMQRRGHEVEVFTNEHFGPAAELLDLPFTPLGSDALYRQVLMDPALWQPGLRSLKLVAKLSATLMPEQHRLIAERHCPGRTVVLAGPLAFGARIAQESMGVPLATLQLAPASLLSAEDPPRLPGIPRIGSERRRRLIFHCMHALLDRLVGRDITRYRRTLGLPRVHGYFGRWWNSPQLVLAMFPDWYARPAGDWPKNTRLCGFPLFDPGADAPLPPELTQFLEQGDPPIVFTPGSANAQAAAFFQAAAGACGRLNRRGLLLTRFEEQLPRSLPRGLMHMPYAPLRSLLPHSAAIVHHGGIGTTAQGLAAGIPHVVMPMAHDQLDNAERLEAMGVAVELAPKRFTSERLADALVRLLSDATVHQKADELSKRTANDSLSCAGSALEQLADHEDPAD